MMKKKCQYSKIITLSGLDGSGKSTQIELLKKYLREQGRSFYYFHAVEFSIANKKGFKNKDSGFKNKSVISANWLQIQLRKIALLVDICRFKRLMKKSNVDYIVSDRYFYDSVVNINYLSGKNRYRLVECYIPHPDHAFFIKISTEKIMRRVRKPDQGVEYLKAKEKLFEEKIKDWDMIVVDGTRSKEDIFEEIKSKINV